MDADTSDGEADTSKNNNDSVLEEPITIRPNKRRSVFNITLKTTLEERVSVEYKEHENKLKAELREWVQIWRDVKEHLQALKNSKQRVDITFLPQNKRDYLDQAPNLRKFIRDSLQFQQDANVFLRKDLAEALDVQNNLHDICECQLETCKRITVNNLLANSLT